MSDTLKSEIMFTDVVTIHPSKTLEEGLSLLREKNLRCIPVVDDEKTFLGMFSAHEVIEHLVPIAGFLGESLGFAIGAGPDLAEKLTKFFPHKIEEFADKKVHHIKPDTPTWEDLRALVKYGSPLPVVDDENGHKFIGLISEQSALHALLQHQKQS